MNRVRSFAVINGMKGFYLFGLLSLLMTCSVRGQELGPQGWTRFRGPGGRGISDAKTIPATWMDENVNWKVKLPGRGHGSPVIWKDKVFLTCENPESAGGMLLAFDVSDGHTLWSKRYKLTAYRHHRDNCLAVTTPVVDAERVYVLWQTRDEAILAAVDHSGRDLWQRTFPGVYSRFGPGCSPMLFEDIVVFTHEHRQGSHNYESAWIAVDRKTGRDRWIRKRNNSQISYSTPCVYSPEGQAPQLIFTSNAHGVTGIDPSNGEVIWELGSVLPDRVVSSPVVAGDVIVAACGKGGAGLQLVVVRPGSKDNPQRAEVVYKHTGKLAPYVPTSLVKDGLLFTFHDQGDVACMRLEDGKMLWCEKPGGRFYGSPVWVDGYLYCINRAGELLVIKAAPTYELVDNHPLGEKSHATPAITNGKMYLRTYSHLICIGGIEN